MKKITLLLLFLFISVITTSCINNLAVQQLNSKAKEQISKGDTEAAICRLESSLDLDGNIFETYYNLGIAYIDVKKYDKAISMLNKATELKPDFADSYYSLAIAKENLAYAIINHEDLSKDKDTDDDDDNETSDKVQDNNNKPLTDEEKSEVINNFNSSIKMYEKYLSLIPDSNDKDKIKTQIDSINSKLTELE